MKARTAIATALAVLLVATHPGDASAASRRKICRVACYDEIAACVEQGLGTRRACKRELIRGCKHDGVALCADPAAIRTGDTWVLIAPDPIDAGADVPTAATVSWADTNTQESGYMVERSTAPDGGFVEVAVTLADATSVVDTELTPDRTYYYRVRAYRKRGKKNLYSWYSSVAMAHTPPAGGRTTTTSTTSTTTTVPSTTTTSSSTTSSTAVSSTTTSSTIATQNQLPIADAGPDKTASPDQVLVFDGRGSYDPDGTIVQYYWNFGDGGVWGTDAVVSHSYAATGTYTVTLYVGDNDNAWTSDTMTVTVLQTNSTTTSTTSTSSTTTTTSSTSSTSTSTAPSTSTSSTSTSTLPSTSTSTSFTTSTAPPTTTSTSTSTSSTSTSTTTSTAPNQPPVANAGPDKQASVGQSVAFDGSASFDSDGRIVAYAWNFGDGATAVTAVASHTYQAAGTYTALLWVQDDAGAWSTDTAVVTVAGTGGGEWLGLETGTSSQQTTSVAHTGTNDVLAGGFTNDTVSIGPITLSGQSGRLDGYVAKYLSSGSVAWARQLAAGAATGSMVIVEGVAGDAGGNAVVVGRFIGNLQAGATTLTSSGGQDIFVVRYAADGSLTWARRFGGALDDVANAVAIAADGSVFVTGYYTGAVDFGGGVLEETKIQPAPTVFVLKLTPNGTHAWSRSFAGTATEMGNALAIAPSGDVVVGGTFTDRFDLGSGQLRTFGVTDGFVVELTSAGAYRWGRQVGGTNVDEVAAVATDGSGNVAIAGKFRGTATFGGPSLSATPTVSDVFVASYTSAGGYRWARSAGSEFNEDGASGVACDGSGTVFVVGAFMGSADFGGPTPIQSSGGRDAFLLELDSTGAYRSVDAWGGTGNDEALAAAAWGAGHVAAGGFFRNTAVVAGTPVTSTGSSDGFATCVAR